MAESFEKNSCHEELGLSRLQNGDLENASSDEEKQDKNDAHDVTITVTSEDVPAKVERKRKLSETSFRQSEGGSPVPNYARGRRASGARLGSEERVRKISFGIGGIPKSGSYGGQPKDEDNSDFEDSLLVIATRRQSSFVLGPTLMGYNRRQWLNLLAFAIVDFCSASVISLQAPFFPPEAISRGASALTYAAPFFAYEFTVFIMFPIFGRLFGNTSSKLLFNSGVFITSVSLVIFGSLTMVKDLPTFIVLSFILRVIEGIGYSAFSTAKYSIISLEFPQNAASTFASLEKFYFLGCCIAPILAGIFIEAASTGRLLPFTIFGLLLSSAGFFTFFVMPPPEPEANEIVVANEQLLGGKVAEFWPVMKIPSVLLGFCAILAASCSIGFLNVNLEPHIHQWHYSAPVVAAIFILSSGMYSISASVWAWFREKVNNSKYIMFMGSVLIFCGFCLIGPVPWIPIQKTTGIICIGLFIHGIGLGASIVSGYMLALHNTIENGFADNVTTFGLISAIFTSVFSFGQMIGCCAAGILLDTVGFRYGVSFILGFQLLLIVTVFGFIVYDSCSNSKVKIPSFLVDLDDELDPLLRSNQESRLDSIEDTTIHEGQIYNPEI